MTGDKLHHGRSRYRAHRVAKHPPKRGLPYGAERIGEVGFQEPKRLYALGGLFRRKSNCRDMRIGMRIPHESFRTLPLELKVVNLSEHECPRGHGLHRLGWNDGPLRPQIRGRRLREGRGPHVGSRGRGACLRESSTTGWCRAGERPATARQTSECKSRNSPNSLSSHDKSKPTPSAKRLRQWYPASLPGGASAAATMARQRTCQLPSRVLAPLLQLPRAHEEPSSWPCGFST